MRCGACNEENRADAAFCMACGRVLTARCAACGRELPASARFCDGCGAPVATDAVESATPPAALLRERPPSQGERRTVTVLFIDAVGSTERSARMDPEELHRVVHECTQLMIDAVNRFDGTVTQFRGDGIMAIFGAPAAHEDSARRGVAAAIAMRDGLADYAAKLSGEGKRSFAYRIGMHTGPVIVGSIGSDFSMDYTAIGDTVNLAARMEQWAAPGTVYITGATQRAVAPYFEFRDLGWLEVKGKAEPVHVYETLRASAIRSRLDVAAERGLTPYIGREAQRALLRERYELAAEGNGQVLFISGEAGMGKSRLLLEFRRSLRDARWLEGRCIDWGTSYAYRPIIEIVRAAFGIDERDDEACISERIDEAVARWPAECAAMAPLYKYLLLAAPSDPAIAALDPRERSLRTLDALRTLLAQEARIAPIVLCVEDLHWADEQSLEALGALIDAARDVRALIIVTHRPYFAPAFATRDYFSHAPLPLLRPDDGAEMVRSVLQGDGVPASLQSMIVAKADGNPFFIEEVARSLIETGVLRAADDGYELVRPAHEVSIPDTIHEVLLSRLDRLHPASRELAQYAAVIGREVPRSLLAHVAGDGDAIALALAELKSAELIYEDRGEGETSYTFKHALTQEVALSTLLGARHKQLHRDVAAAIASVYADRLWEHHEALSLHYYRGEEWAPARLYSELVAERAQSLFAPRATIEHLDRAIDASRHLGLMPAAAVYRARGLAHEAVGDFEAARADLEAALGAAREADDGGAIWQAHADLGMLWAGRDYERTGDHFAQAHEIARQLEDRAMVARSLNRLGNWRINTDRPREGLADHEEALRIFQQLDDRRGIAETLDFLQMGMAIAGDLRRSVEAGREAAALYDELGDRKARAGVLATLTLGGVNAESGTMEQIDPYPGDPSAFALEGLEISRQIEWRAGEAFALMQLGLQQSGWGRYGASVVSLVEGLRIAEEIGHEQWQAGCLTCLGVAYGEALMYEEAEDCLGRALDLAQRMGSAHWRGCVIGSAAMLAVEQGRVAEAAAALDAAIKATTADYSIGQRTLLLARMVVETARGAPEVALRVADQLAEALPRPPSHGVRSLPWVAQQRGAAYAALGRLDEAEADFEAALDLARRVSARGLVWRAAAALGDVRAARGDRPGAEAAWSIAWQAIEDIAAALDEPMRRRFLDAGAIERIRGMARIAR